MNENRLQVGIDFSQKRADFCLLLPDGQTLDAHQAFANSRPGYEAAKQMLLTSLATHACNGLDISGEATSYYWLPFFQQLAHDPDLAEHQLQLFLLNPRWVRWFKKCFPLDDKTDATDPFYIAERSRTRPPSYGWSPQEDWLPLRFYTRLRFHLTQTLTRAKNYFLAHLFLRASAYHRLKPFANTFGVTSSQVLTHSSGLEALANLPPDQLRQRLSELSGNHLPDPVLNAHKLQQVIAESFPLGQRLTIPVQRLLDITLLHIRFLEAQIEQVDGWIAAEIDASQPHVAQLTTIPGIGPVFASGIAAEIGDLSRFFQSQKWDKKRKRYRSKNLRDVEDAVAKLAGLWWPRSASGDFEAQDRKLAKSGNRYLRYFLIEAADHLRRSIPHYTRFYARKYKEATKHHHKRALILTARKSVGLFVGLLHRNEPYRPQEV